MGYVSWIFGTVWRYCANVEALVTVCSLAFAYRFLFGGGDAFWEVLDRVIVKLELKMTGNYDRVPNDGESRVSAQRTRASWELRRDNVGVFAIQGRRPYMEDRFNVVSQLEHTDTSIYGIFDGHGGEFAADYTEKTLFKLVMVRLLKSAVDGMEEDLTTMLSEEILHVDDQLLEIEKSTHEVSGDAVCREFKLKAPAAEELLDYVACSRKQFSFQICLESGDGSGTFHNWRQGVPDSWCHEADKKFIGTTALIALLRHNKLVVANVGDSRGILCDQHGNAVPLSSDHKPHNTEERKRIKKAGGFVSFNGVWRVAGILAISRALGDYPLKERQLIIAEPDVKTFDLDELQPEFLILASDGLWDAFSNDEACTYIREHLDEPHYGAKSIVLQAYYRGSLDNITVMVINFGNNTVVEASIEDPDDRELDLISDAIVL